jgi:uncharacterized protein with HEPN domain
LRLCERNPFFIRTSTADDVLAGASFGVDLPTVWKTIQDDLPPLKAQLREVLRSPAGNE